LTLIALTQLAPSFSAIISDTLVWGPEAQSELPSDYTKPDLLKSKDAGNFERKLFPKCYVIHPTLAVTFAGSACIIEVLLNRLAEDLTGCETIDENYLFELSQELELKDFSFIFVHLTPTRNVKIYSHSNCLRGENKQGLSFIASGSGAEIFRSQHEDFGVTEYLAEGGEKEKWIALMRGLSFTYPYIAKEFYSNDQLHHSFGGLFDILFIDHNLGFFSFGNFWQTICPVYPTERGNRNYYPIGPFMYHHIEPDTNSLILDCYQSFKQTTRGFKCQKRRFIAKRYWPDFRKVIKPSMETWLTTHPIFFGEKIITWANYIDQKGKNQKPWLKRRPFRNGTEFVIRGYRMERGRPAFMENDTQFENLLKACPDFDETLYLQNSSHTARRFVRNDLQRKG